MHLKPEQCIMKKLKFSLDGPYNKYFVSDKYCVVTFSE